MAGVLAYDKREPGSGRNVLLPPWLKTVAVLEKLGEAHAARSEDDVLTPRHSGQSATVRD
jgi:hypothetical protein